MMLRRISYIILVILGWAWDLAGAHSSAEGPVVFADRAWALSGDTVWFVVAGAGEESLVGNVVHVRLLSPTGHASGQVMLLLSGGVGQGYLALPDTLRTGVYRLQAYAGNPGDGRGDGATARWLTVYHRFDEAVSSLTLPADFTRPLEPSGGSGNALAQGAIHLTTDNFSPRGEVTFTVELPAGVTLKEGVVSASLGEDPMAGEEPYVLLSRYGAPLTGEPLPAEENGFFVEGRVVPRSGDTLPPRSLVLLSIPGENPWFDYCFAGEDGYFRFMLKNAYGTAVIYLRAIARYGEELAVELSTGSSAGAGGQISTLPLSEEMTRFIREMTEAGWYEKLFFGAQEPPAPRLDLLSRSQLPFYGFPEQRVVPSEFTDLPDFREISRELLPAVRFRQRGDHYALRIIADQETKYFDKSPLRLVNGIPVFSDDRLFGLKSTDIDYIDLIYRERIFGDISFKGVVAIKLNEGAEGWLREETSLYRYTLSCLQTPAVPGYHGFSPVAWPRHLPDLRRVFLFRRVLPGENPAYTFMLSDLKGPVVLKLEGMTSGGEPLIITRKIMIR